MIRKTEYNILQNLKKSDRPAFKIIFHNYYQPLLIFAQKFVPEELAKDFVQDCFFELWQNRKKIEITSSLSAYLFTIIKNKCYKHLKKEQRQITGSNEFGLLLKKKELEFYTHSENSILQFGIKDRIKKVIKHLPGKCKEVFMESRINGLTNKEIAEKLQISIKTVEKHISKALGLFRNEFNDIITILLILLFQ